eukprot:IDg20445t1
MAMQKKKRAQRVIYVLICTFNTANFTFKSAAHALRIECHCWYLLHARVLYNPDFIISDSKVWQHDAHTITNAAHHSIDHTGRAAFHLGAGVRCTIKQTDSTCGHHDGDDGG